MDPNIAGRYRDGFSECASEVAQYLSKVDGLTPDMRMRIMNHLSACMHNMTGKMLNDSQIPIQFAMPYQLPIATPMTTLPGHSTLPRSGVQSPPNSNISTNGLNGHFQVHQVQRNNQPMTFIMPNGQLMPCFVPAFPTNLSHNSLCDTNMVKKEPCSPPIRDCVSVLSENTDSSCDPTEHSDDDRESENETNFHKQEIYHERRQDNIQHPAPNAHVLAEDVWRPW